MPDTSNIATDFLKDLGSVEDILAEAETVSSLDMVKYNSHIHLPPNFSAFETVEQAVELASKEDVRVLGAGNYYDFDVYQDFACETMKKNIFPVFGTEIIALETDLQTNGVKINDPGNPGKYYICGKAISKFDLLSDRAKELLAAIRQNDSKRMCQMAAKIEEVFCRNGLKTGLDDKTIINKVVKRHSLSDANTVVLQERHLAQAFQEEFYKLVPVDQRASVLSGMFGKEPSVVDDPVATQNDIRSHLMKAGKSCYVPETFVTLAEAKELICELGGIPCYPTLADGTPDFTNYESPLESFIQTLKDNNYSMVEFIPLRNTPEVLEKYVTAIRNAGIAVVAGTEHNTLSLDPIEPFCVKSQPIPQVVKDVFWEGCCVLAAHQFLAANDLCGLVDVKNQPNDKYTDPDSRIKELAKIGSVVLKRFNANN